MRIAHRSALRLQYRRTLTASLIRAYRWRYPGTAQKQQPETQDEWEIYIRVASWKFFTDIIKLILFMTVRGHR